MPPFSNAVLHADKVLTRFAMAVLQRAPSASMIAEPGQMGAAYDLWLDTVLRGSVEAGSSTDTLETYLPTGDLMQSFHSFKKMLGSMQQSLERTLLYKAQKAIVWNEVPEDQPWFKAHARRVHRAVCAELLLLHIVKLEYALVLARTSDSMHGTALLDADFTNEHRANIAELRAFMDDDPSPTEMLGNALVEADETEWLLTLMDTRDISNLHLSTALSACGGRTSLGLRAMLRDMACDMIRWHVAAIAAGAVTPFGAEEFPIADDNLMDAFIGEMWTAAKQLAVAHHGLGATPAQIVAYIQRARPAGAPGAAAGAVAADPYSAELLQGGGHQLYQIGAGLPPDPGDFHNVVRDHVSFFWYRVLWENWHQDYVAYKNVRHQHEHNINVGAGPPTAVQVRGLWAATQHASERRLRASVHLVRFRALQAVKGILTGYSTPVDDQNFSDFLLCISNEAFFEAMALYGRAQSDSVGFLPEWTGLDERERLRSIFARQDEYACLVYREQIPVVGQFIMRRNARNIDVAQRVHVHEWRRRQGLQFGRQETAYEHRVQWGLVHCEVPMLADLLLVAAPIALANRQASSDFMPPVKQIHMMLTRALSRFDLVQIGAADGGSLQEQHNNNGHFFYNRYAELVHQAAGVGLAGAIARGPRLTEAQLLGLVRALKAVPDPDATTAHCTQPMGDSEREWLQAVVDAYELANGAGAVAQPHWSAGNNSLPQRLLFQKKVLNCLNHRSYKAIPQGNPEKPHENPETTNVMWRRPMPDMAWTVANLDYTNDCASVYACLALQGAYSVNSLFVIGSSEAFAALQKIWVGPYPASYTMTVPIHGVVVPDNNQNVSFGLGVGGGGGARNVMDPVGYAEIVGPSTREIARRFNVESVGGGAPHPVAFNIPYPAPRQLVDRLVELAGALKQAHGSRKAPFTFPGHWITDGTAVAAQNARWVQMADQVVLDAGATLINFAALPPAVPVPLPADLILVGRARHFR